MRVIIYWSQQSREVEDFPSLEVFGPRLEAFQEDILAMHDLLRLIQGLLREILQPVICRRSDQRI